jgi:serine/threonine protein phosphatase 1
MMFIPMAFWKRRSGRGLLHAPSIPDHQRVYAIGDIHGRADLLIKMHHAVSKHAAISPPADQLIVYLGDYVDRGLEVKETLNILTSSPLQEFHTIFLKGNHEEMLLSFLMDSATLDDWLLLGGQATMMSYGLSSPGQAPHPRQAEDIRQKFIHAFPNGHRDFLLKLKTTYQAGDYLFVHAGLRPGVPLDKQTAEDYLWIREPFLINRKSMGVRVVHGHHITPRPETLPNRIGVDTGAYATGRLSCVVLEADRVEFISVQSNGS